MLLTTYARSFPLLQPAARVVLPSVAVYHNDPRGWMDGMGQDGGEHISVSLREPIYQSLFLRYINLPPWVPIDWQKQAS